MDESTLAEFLSEQRDAIVARFVEEVQRKDLAPAEASRPLLVDHIPRFLNEIIAELSREAGLRLSRDAMRASPTARQHGEQRWALGYDLQALVREYGVLPHCIIQKAKDAGLHFSMDEFDVLARCLSVGVAEAADEYVRHGDAQTATRKTNQAFLAEAGDLLASSLDYRSTLGNLTRLIVPRFADWCSVQITGVSVDSMPVAHVDPSKTEAIRELYRRFPRPSDTPYGAPVALRTGEPQLLATMTPEVLRAVAQSPEHAAMIESIGVRSSISLPLVVQGNTFGVIMMAYGDSGRTYDAADLVLGSELARRASIAIDNARLYELSQDERSRVEAATRAKDEFVAMVSHELRTPLNAILGWLRILRSGSLPEEKREHAFEVIERNAQAQGHLVADLLDISRIITGKLRITLSQVDLGNVIEMATEAVRPAADAKRIQIHVEIDRDGAIMRGDADRLQQVVWNLLANAVKFTPKNGVVRVSVKRVESDFELTVYDNGSGIDPLFLPHVFESFRQAEGGAARPHGGLGLGLSISKYIVEQHGGTIVAESRGSGHGALFRVRLPISPLVSTTMGVSRVPATRKEEDSPAAPVGLHGVRVLVVDDEVDARELLVYVFEASGMEVRTAASAAEALSTLDAFLPDVIVSDIGMPIDDGYSLIRSVRTLADDTRKRIPAIALTAFARNEDRTRALVEGFNLHMAKPVEPSALVRAVADLAGRVSVGPSNA